MISLQFCWPEGKAGAFTTSYDDGVREDRRLVAIFNRCGIRGTWNLNSYRVAATFGESDPVAWTEMATLYAGHEVAVHGWTHPFLDRVPEEQILAEVTGDRRQLEAAVGYPVKGMSLPYGTYDQRVLGMLERCGIVHCRTTRAHQGFHLPDDFLEWHPTCHHARIGNLWAEFRENKDPRKLFYLWGHSYEFDRNKNWELIETFGETVKAARDAGWLWCATNMEIVDLVTSFRALWCSLDGRTVRNTRATPVWGRAGGKVIQIGAGETVTLQG